VRERRVSFSNRRMVTFSYICVATCRQTDASTPMTRTTRDDTFSCGTSAPSSKVPCTSISTSDHADFGQGSTILEDAYLNPPVARGPTSVGKYKTPVGLERLQAVTETLFVERGLPTNLVPNRDVGAQLSATCEWCLQLRPGRFQRGPDLGNGNVDNNDDKDFAGRIFAHPLKNTTFERCRDSASALRDVRGSCRDRQQPNLPAHVTPGRSLS